MAESGSGLFDAEQELFAAFAAEGHELGAHLDVMAALLLVAPLGVDLTHPRAARQVDDAVTAQSPCGTSDLGF